MTIISMEVQLHINWEMICQILRDDFGNRKLYTKFVTHSLVTSERSGKPHL